MLLPKALEDASLVKSFMSAGGVVRDWVRRNPLGVLIVAAFVAGIAGFYGMYATFGRGHAFSALGWMESTWNHKTGYDHGFLVPILMLVLAARRLPDVAATEVKPSRWGLVLMIFGIITYVAAIRSYQARVAVVGLPILVLGVIGWVHSFRAMRLMAFPLCLLYFALHAPGLLQATNGLQVFATKSAFHLSKLFGIEASLSGNQISSIPDGKWGFDIAEGCSGIRSLLALTLISAVYAHLTQKVLWKKIVLFACSVPLAIIGNALRVTSILVVAEYFDPKLAGNAYHDGSGFIFFGVVGLAGLSLVDWALGWNERGRAVVRRLERSTTAPAAP